MFTLALDTTTRAGGCAVARDGVVLLERASDASRPQAARLPGELMSLLEEARVSLSEVDVYAVAIGPGSFTGLRVGIATMQGLAFAAGRPLVGVSALDALARIAGESVTRVAPWVDAWRGEVYAALYESGHEIAEPVVARPVDLLVNLAGEPTVFIGDGAATHRDLIQNTLGHLARISEPTTPRLASTIATIATNAARAGHKPSPHAIAALYVRRSDAELARNARSGQ